MTFDGAAAPQALDSYLFCEDTSCPLHSEIDSKHDPLISCVQLSASTLNVELRVKLPCMLCSKRKSIDFSKLLKKESTKDLLKRGSKLSFDSKV